MRTGLADRLLVVALCFLATNGLGQAAKAGSDGPRATLLLAADVASTVKLDGEKVADLQPDVPAKLQVAPGEYLVSAATLDGQKWSKVVQVKSPKTIVKIEFGGSPAATVSLTPEMAKDSPAGTGTLLVLVDSPVRIEIDNKRAGFVPGTPGELGQVSLRLTPGRHFVKAVSRDFPEVSTATDVQIREGSQEIVRAMVADQVAAKEAVAREAKAARVKIEKAKTRVKELDLRWVNILAGEFRMGCSSGGRECSADEKPAHTVQVTKPFQMMATEVTAGQFQTWALSQGYEPPQQPGWSGPDVPVVSVTWNDAQAFCSAFGGRLPTEAEWEYVARGSLEGERYGSIGAIAWYLENSERKAHPVGTKQPNAFGLHDMFGNVSEWCMDWYSADHYREKIETDPIGPTSGQYRVLRGGSWDFAAARTRASSRFRVTPTARYGDLGFRCLRDPNSPVTPSFSPDLKRFHSPQAVASGMRTTTWRIQEPTVTRAETIYDGNEAAPAIQFQPGDTVDIEAGGCVQTGGSGATWKRYVNPIGPNADRLYFVKVGIPGVTVGLTPLRTAGCQYDIVHPDKCTVHFAGSVPGGIPDSQRYFRLGYVDDTYGNNSYWAHDDGTEGQCRDIGNAYVTLTITHHQ